MSTVRNNKEHILDSRQKDYTTKCKLVTNKPRVRGKQVEKVRRIGSTHKLEALLDGYQLCVLSSCSKLQLLHTDPKIIQLSA